jgi:hypothetical protein
LLCADAAPAATNSAARTLERTRFMKPPCTPAALPAAAILVAAIMPQAMCSGKPRQPAFFR